MKTLGAIGIALFAGALYASTGRDLVVSVPFDFTVGQTLFTPGEYRVDVQKATSSLVIESVDGAQRAMILAQKTPGDSQVSPLLTFNVYGEARFLSKIQTGGTTVWQLARGSQETQLGRAGEPVVTTVRARLGGE